MKYSIKILLGIASLILLQCSDWNSKSDKIELEANLKVVFKEQISIQINNKSINTYNYNCCIQAIDKEKVIGYNYAYRTLDIINVEKPDKISHLKLETEGPNSISSLQAMNYVNDSVILLLTKKELVLAKVVKDENRVKTTKTFLLSGGKESSIQKFNYDEYRLEFISNNNLMDGSRHILPYDKTNNRVFLRQFRVTPDHEREYFLYPIGGWLNLENGSYEELENLKYPKFIQDSGSDLPFLYQMNMTLTEEKAVFNFGVDSKIYECPINSLNNPKKVQSYFSEESKTNFSITPLEGYNGMSFSDLKSTEKGIRFFEHSAQYFPIYWDKYRNLYYKISKEKTQESQKSSKGHRIRRFGHHYISIFNEDFDLITEKRLPPNFDAKIIVLEKHIIFPIKDPPNESTLTFGTMELIYY